MDAPHAMVERIAVESGAGRMGTSINLVDPMCGHDPFIENVCRRILREMARPDRCARLAMDALGQELVIRLLREHSNVSKRISLTAKVSSSHRDWRLRRTVGYRDAHLADDAGLDDIAAEVGLCPPTSRTCFATGRVSRHIASSCAAVVKELVKYWETPP